MEVVRLSSQAVIEASIDKANAAKAKDDAIDELEVVIDAEAVRYMSMRAPVARDLRLLVTGMKAAHDLERVGDEATTIARRAIKLDMSGAPIKDFLNIPQIATLTLEMLRDSIDSLIDGDAEKAIGIPLRDKDVDRLHKQNYQTLLELIQKDPARVSVYLDLIFVSKCLERIADHASNIAEEVVYLYRAEDIRHSQSVKDAKADDAGVAGA